MFGGGGWGQLAFTSLCILAKPIIYYINVKLPKLFLCLLGFQGSILKIGGVWKVGELDEGGQKVSTSSYKVNKTWEVRYTMMTIVNSIVFSMSKSLRE